MTIKKRKEKMIHVNPLLRLRKKLQEEEI